MRAVLKINLIPFLFLSSLVQSMPSTQQIQVNSIAATSLNETVFCMTFGLDWMVYVIPNASRGLFKTAGINLDINGTQGPENAREMIVKFNKNINLTILYISVQNLAS